MWCVGRYSVLLKHFYSAGLAQFIDLQPDVSTFQRQFVSEIKRCEEMERKLRYVETEIVKERLEMAEQEEGEVAAPAPREMVELETTLSTVETNLREVNTNYVALRKNHLELTELKSLLKRAEVFLTESQFTFQQQEHTGESESSRLLDHQAGPEYGEKDIEDQVRKCTPL